MDWTHRLGELRTLLADKLGAKGPTLSSQVRRAQRRLPRRLRRDAQALLRAETMARHPRFARMVDPREVARSHARLSRHLGAIDTKAIRRDRAKNAAAGLGLIVLAILALVVWLLWWRGLV